jgi:hypothetical protein
MKVILSVPDEGYSERTWWRLFQKRTVRTKFDIYVCIMLNVAINQNVKLCTNNNTYIIEITGTDQILYNSFFSLSHKDGTWLNTYILTYIV